MFIPILVLVVAVLFFIFLCASLSGTGDDEILGYGAVVYFFLGYIYSIVWALEQLAK